METSLRVASIGAPDAELVAWLALAREAGFAPNLEAGPLAFSPPSGQAPPELVLAGESLAEAALRRRESPAGAPPVVVLSPDADAARALEFIRGGAFDVWSRTQPDARAQLERACAEALGRARTRRADVELARTRRYFEEGPVVVFRWGARAGWPVEQVSPNVSACFAVSAEDFITGRVSYASVVHPDDLARVVAEVEAHAASGVAGFDQEYRIVRPDGSVRRLLDHTVVVRDRAGAVTHFEGYVLDQTEFREAQLAREDLARRLEQLRNLDSLGLMAGGVAHDLCNLLTRITGNVELTQADPRLTERGRARLEDALDASRHAAELARQMLGYAGRCRVERQPTELSGLARDMAQLLESVVERKVRLELDLAPDLPRIDGYPAQLQQVLLNLVINAAEACAERGGRVRVTTRLNGPLRVALEVRDDGAGMDAATQRRLFEPLFTTKPRGRGLGLSSVQAIVRAHGGTIEVESQPGQGALLRVLLPVAAPAVEPAAALPRRDAGRTRPGRALVIDDNAQVGEVAAQLLRSAGWEARVALGGAAALELLAADPQSVDVVVLDRTMPGLGGLETLTALRRLRADLPVVLTSGFGEDECAAELARGAPLTFLAKPFTFDALVACVEAARGG